MSAPLRLRIYADLSKAYGSDYYVLASFFNDSQLCERFQRAYSLPPVDFPARPVDFARFAHSQNNQRKREELITPDPACYQLPADVRVVWLDTIEGLRGAVQEMRRETVLGWDCEWFMLRKSDCVAHVIQIGGEAKVWVVDGVWLENEANQEQGDVLFSYLFESQTITHVFMGKDDFFHLNKWGWSAVLSVVSAE